MTAKHLYYFQNRIFPKRQIFVTTDIFFYMRSVAMDTRTVAMATSFSRDNQTPRQRISYSGFSGAQFASRLGRRDVTVWMTSLYDAIR